MKKRILMLFTAFLALASCNSSGDETNGDVDKTFFPIEGNIKAELNALDSMPVAVNRYSTRDGRTDTSVISKEDFRAIAATLYTPDIASPELKKYFKEAVFYDKTTEALTMSYTTASEKPEIRKIEVNMNPATDKVRSIYVEKQDAAALRKMIWTSGRNLQVITVPADGSSETIDKYEWGM